VITQWDWQVVEKVGLLKMDFLGLANLTILDHARKLIEARHPGTVLDLQNLPMDYDDPSGQPRRTFDMLGEGETTAVFQLESAGMRRCLKGLRPNRISDLLAILALYRPGPMDSIPAFIAAKNGKTPVTYLHPDLKPILAETYGVCVYQDQVLQIVRAIAGFSWGEADVLRKAMGKKIAALMAEQRDKFVARAGERGYSRDFLEQLWALIAPFAGYGFPKAHAAAYAVVSYQTAFLKATYPAEYMAAVLTSEAGNPAKVAEAVAECRRLGVEVRPPDVNRSGLGFTLEDGPGGTAIRFGLSGVKNVGHGAIEMLIRARSASPKPALERSEGSEVRSLPSTPSGAKGKGPKPGGRGRRTSDFGPSDSTEGFRDLADFCRRIDLRQLNKRALESLIKAGATDAFGERAALLAGLDAAMALGQQDQRARLVGQTNLFDLLGAGAALEAAPGAFALPAVEPADRKQRLAWEKEMIGLYISEHPLAGVARALAGATTCSTTELSEQMAGQTVTIGGFVAALRLIPTKKGDLMAAVELEDLAGSVEVLVFPRTYQANRDVLREDAVVLVRGKVDTRDEQPKVLCDTVEPFEAAAGAAAAATEGSAAGTSGAGAQTAYPLDRAEAECAGLDAPGLPEAGGAAEIPDDDPFAGLPVAPEDQEPSPAREASEHDGGGAAGNDRSRGAWEDEGDARSGRGTEGSGPVTAGPVGDGQARRARRARIVELVLERSARDERDVNRLVRLDELLERFPGDDRVVLRIVRNGRDTTALERADRVRCCEELLAEAIKELGEDAVRVRVPPGWPREPAAAGAWPAANDAAGGHQPPLLASEYTP
jgi:DNA polymerase-3 subunit alpha